MHVGHVKLNPPSVVCGVSGLFDEEVGGCRTSSKLTFLIARGNAGLQNSRHPTYSFDYLFRRILTEARGLTAGLHLTDLLARKPAIETGALQTHWLS
jgi:hypothetical protein